MRSIQNSKTCIVKLQPSYTGYLQGSVGAILKKDGVSSLWGHDSHLVEKTVLFDKKYGFYSADNINTLQNTAQSAKEDYGIQLIF
jgi:hypothetical protein